MRKLSRSFFHGLPCAMLLGIGGLALAQSGVSGSITDQANAAVANASVELINLTSNSIRSVRVDASGKYSFSDVSPGQYRLVVKAPGYNDTGRTIAVESAPLTEDFTMTVGNIKEVITVTADRGLRADADIPLNVTVETAQTIEEKLPVSPGEILKDTPGLFVFNTNSPLASPNLRGLQASRVLLVVDGERVNNSRTEIQTFGASLGSYIDTFNVEAAEVVAGAGASLYGTDSLSGTVNFTTREPARPDKGWIFGGKLQGLYSSNETGRKGNVTLNLSDPKFALNLSGTLFRFDNYRFGDVSGRDDVSLRAVQKQQDELKYLSNSNTSRQDFAISDSFARNFGLGTPADIDGNTVTNSLNHGANSFVNLWLHPAEKHSFRIKAQNNRLGYYGFPNQAPPYWHDLQWTSFEKNDKYGVRYNGVEFNNTIRRLAVGFYRQKLVRPIDNITLVTPLVRPPCIRGLFESAANCTAANQAIFQTVTRPSTLTFNKQGVTTNGADGQVTFQLAPWNSLLVGYQFWRDKSSDEFNSSVYNATPGTPGRTVPIFSPFAGYTLNTAIPVIAGKGTADSFNQEGAVFIQDDYDATRWLRFAVTYRFSKFTSRVFKAPGFPLAGADAAIAGPAPDGIDLGGATPLTAVVTQTGDVSFSRTANTGSFAVIGRPRPEISVFGRVGNSLRIPALIETFFFRVFNQGTFAFIFFPNANIRPERGVNVDTGVKVNYRYFRGGVTYYNNTYTNFIEQSAPLLQLGGPGTVTARINAALQTNFGFSFWVQRRNTGRARTQGLEGEFDIPISLGGAGSLSLSSAMSWQQGEDLTPTYAQRCSLDRQAQYNSYVGNSFFDFGSRTPNTTGAACPLTGTPASNYSSVPFERLVPFMATTTLRYQEPKGRFYGEINVRQRTRIHRLDPDLQENFLRFGYFTFRSLAGVTVYNARAGYSWYRENGRLSLNLALDNLSDKFYAEPFQYTAARGRSLSVGFTVESFNLLKLFK
ncbi:MAG: TonB-dependent receptor domain-containing protein [Blastocatellia bacterium]